MKFIPKVLDSSSSGVIAGGGARALPPEIWHLICLRVLAVPLEEKGLNAKSLEALLSAARFAGVCRAARAATLAPEVVRLCWPRLVALVPSGLFRRTHLGARLRVLRFADMVRRGRCDRCPAKGMRPLRLPGLGLRLCASCRSGLLVPWTRIAPFMGRTPVPPSVWLGCPGQAYVLLEAVLATLE